MTKFTEMAKKETRVSRILENREKAKDVLDKFLLKD